MSRHLRTICLTLLAVTLAVLATGCTRVRGSGDIVSNTFDVGGVTNVVFSTSGGLKIVAGDAEELVVETDDNVLEYVDVEVKGDTLTIGMRPSAAFGVDPTELQFTLEIPELASVANSGSGTISARDLDMNDLEVTLSGSGAVKVDDIDCDDLRVELSGSGSIELTGACRDAELEVSGSGNLSASDVEAETVSVTVSGSGSATVWAVEKLDATVSGSGTINYYGDPEVDSSTPGSGDLRDLGTR